MILSNHDIAVYVYGLQGEHAMTEAQRVAAIPSVRMAEALVTAFIGRDPSHGTHTEVLAAGPAPQFSGLVPDDFVADIPHTVTLTHTPVLLDGLVVTENRRKQDFSGDPLDASAWQLDDVVGGYSRSGILRRLNGSWPTYPGGIQVEYTGGLAGDSQELKNFKIAVAEQAKIEMIADADGSRGKSSESMGDYSVSWRDASNRLDVRVTAILESMVSYGDFL